LSVAECSYGPITTKNDWNFAIKQQTLAGVQNAFQKKKIVVKSNILNSGGKCCNKAFFHSCLSNPNII
jgi:hypothetical protein